MTNANYASEERKESALVNLFVGFSEQNDRYMSLLHKVEKIGHKLKDTNAPEKALQAERLKPAGALDELGEQIDRFRMSNNRFEETIQKLESLI